MTEIPEHLLKRSQDAKAKADGDSAPPPESVAQSDDDGEPFRDLCWNKANKRELQLQLVAV